MLIMQCFFNMFNDSLEHSTKELFHIFSCEFDKIIFERIPSVVNGSYMSDAI